MPPSTDRVVVGLVSAGAMGSVLGARLRDGGARVLVALDGRSARTSRFASEAGLEDVGALAVLVREAALVLSVVPPESALGVARDVAAVAGGTRPLVLDLNATSPATVRQLAAVLDEAGIELVDGAISGPPPHRAGTTRVYLSGPRADEAAELPLVSVERVVVGDAVGSASAVKMCTASVYKGRVALLTQALRTAHAHGVVEHVLDDLMDAGLADRERIGTTLAQASTKAWRYIAEMGEIADTQQAAGLPPELFRALSIVYADLAERALAAAPEDVPERLPLADVLERLNGGAGARAGAGGPPRSA